MPVRLTLPQVAALARRALVGSGTSESNALPVADSVMDAEAEGLPNVGLGYLPLYCEHLRCGKVEGRAEPAWQRPAPGSVLVDAGLGFAHPAFEVGRPVLVEAAGDCGIAAMAITRSYAAGVIGWFVERLAADGLVAFGFANSPPSIAPWGGKRKFFGTNPLAFAVPRSAQRPLVVDQSSSVTAKVNVVQAAARGKSIPEGWALDPEGRPTTDPEQGLAGSLAPAGGYKGAALAMLVDIMAAGLTGANFSFQASSFGDNTGGPPGVGQFFIAIEPARFAGGGFAAHLEAMLEAMRSEPGVRLPGDRRHAHRAGAERDGVEVPDALHERLLGYCG